MTHPEYSKGYNAGRRKTEAEVSKFRDWYSAGGAESRAFRRDVFIAVLSSSVGGQRGWQVNGKQCAKAGDYIELAKQFADLASASFKP